MIKKGDTGTKRYRPFSFALKNSIEPYGRYPAEKALAASVGLYTKLLKKGGEVRKKRRSIPMTDLVNYIIK
ncbi:MAG: hypothetical protein LUF68_09190 [Clostridiales bacterium]|nr:hypothetical protein [Clostridiales bacterium]